MALQPAMLLDIDIAGYRGHQLSQYTDQSPHLLTFPSFTICPFVSSTNFDELGMEGNKDPRQKGTHTLESP